jgi:hypothetical protein
MVIKGKTEELLVKQLKTCEKKIQELTDSIKRPNLGIEEGEEVQAKGMRNIFKKIITENFPNLAAQEPSWFLRLTWSGNGMHKLGCGGVKVLPLLSVFPVMCISSVSPRFYFRKHTFCFLPLSAILESLLATSFM